MVSIEEAVIARLKKDNIHFEILVDPNKALEFKKGKEYPMDEILAIPGVYHDARKGDTVATSDLQKEFGTTNTDEIAKKIIKEGEMQFTTEQRRKMTEDVTNKVVDIIAKRAINPQTNTPHPPSRILNAMHQTGVRIDPFQDAEAQVDHVIKSIKALLPIKLQRIIFQLTIPAQHAGRIYSVLKRSVESFEEKWLNDGSLQATLNVPAGIQMDILKQVGDATHGDFKSEIIKKEDV